MEEVFVLDEYKDNQALFRFSDKKKLTPFSPTLLETGEVLDSSIVKSGAFKDRTKFKIKYDSSQLKVLILHNNTPVEAQVDDDGIIDYTGEVDHGVINSDVKKGKKESLSIAFEARKDRPNEFVQIMNIPVEVEDTKKALYNSLNDKVAPSPRSRPGARKVRVRCISCQGIDVIYESELAVSCSNPKNYKCNNCCSR